MNRNLTADLLQFSLYRLVRDGQWTGWGLEPDSIRVDVPADAVGPNEIRATVSLTFRSSDSNGGWTTEWIVRVPCLAGDRLGTFRVSNGCDPATVETVEMTDLADFMLDFETESSEFEID